MLYTIIFDEFDFDTIANGYWYCGQVNGSYEILDSKLRLYITSAGPHYSSAIYKPILLGENMTVTTRVLGSTPYRFALGWHLSDRYVLLEFDDYGFSVTNMIIPTMTWGWIGQFGPTPAPNTWYILSLEIRPTPFTVIASVYDDNGNLLGCLNSDLDWNYSDIRFVEGAGVWTNTTYNPLPDYYIDWVRVTGYYPKPVETSVRVRGKNYPVVVISNTTIKRMFATANMLFFKSSEPAGEKGYINVIFPMVNTTRIRVFIDGRLLIPPPFPVINTNGTLYFIYFEFTLSTHDIKIQFGPTPVGGFWVPINKFELLAPLIGLASLITVATISVIYVKHRKKQQN